MKSTSCCFKKGAIRSNGQFIWDDQPEEDEGARSQVASFWQEEELSFARRMEEAAQEEQQIQLPEDIMPAFDGLLRDRE
jgi:hypothetical protein